MQYSADEIRKNNPDIEDFMEILLGDKEFLNEKQYKVAEYFIKNYRFIKYVQDLETDENGFPMTDEKRDNLIKEYAPEPYCDFLERLNGKKRIY
jgi:hypothetical protein